jgi:hypothetical protein
MVKRYMQNLLWKSFGKQHFVRQRKLSDGIKMDNMDMSFEFENWI